MAIPRPLLLKAGLFVGALALVLIIYPAVFWAWYFGFADKVTATVTTCTQLKTTCSGEGVWTMDDGTPGHGPIDSTGRGEIGTTIAVHALRGYALVDGPINSGPAMWATGIPVWDVVMVAFLLYLRRWDQRRYPSAGRLVKT